MSCGQVHCSWPQISIFDNILIVYRVQFSLHTKEAAFRFEGGDKSVECRPNLTLTFLFSSLFLFICDAENALNENELHHLEYNRLICWTTLHLYLFTDSYVNAQHALPQNISQFETPALPQPAFDQQALTQGTKGACLWVWFIYSK